MLDSLFASEYVNTLIRRVPELLVLKSVVESVSVMTKLLGM